MHGYTDIWMCGYMDIWIYENMTLWIHGYICIYIYVYMYICTYDKDVWICGYYIYIYICICLTYRNTDQPFVAVSQLPAAPCFHKEKTTPLDVCTRAVRCHFC